MLVKAKGLCLFLKSSREPPGWKIDRRVSGYEAPRCPDTRAQVQMKLAGQLKSDMELWLLDHGRLDLWPLLQHWSVSGRSGRSLVWQIRPLRSARLAYEMRNEDHLNYNKGPIPITKINYFRTYRIPLLTANCLLSSSLLLSRMSDFLVVKN